MEKELLTLSFAFRPLSDDPDGSEGDLAASDELEDELEDDDEDEKEDGLGAVEGDSDDSGDLNENM